MPKLNLPRDVLAKIAQGNQRAVFALEQVLRNVGDTFPTSLDEVNALAGSALAVAQSSAAALAVLADTLERLESAPAALPPGDADDTAPRVELGTIASQNNDSVDITGGSITGMTKNDATGIALTDDTTTNATMYPVFGTAAGASSLKLSSTKLTWNPSTGLFSAPSVSAQLNGALGLTTPAAAVVTTLSASGQITSTVATGTAPFSIASTTIVPNLNVSQLLGGTWAIPGTIGSTTPNTGSFTTLTASGNLLVGVSSGSSSLIIKSVSEGFDVMYSGGSTSTPSLGIKAATNISWNAAATAVLVAKNSSTLRSINAAGSVNANGADYAEYMTKADDCGTIAKGAIVGVDADGKLTDKWAFAVSFLIKSTDPSYVGGDVWGTPEAIGMDRPDPQSDDYESKLAEFNSALEVARQRVDRIAYCGQVPVNVQGAKPGQYVVPVQDGAGITTVLINDADITFEQYRRAVGVVQNILPDGRANVRVKVI